jgi:hypothetical protein
MKHVVCLSKAPAKASTTTGICGTVTNDYSALLCFMTQLLTDFFLPLAQLKNPTPPSEGEGEGEGEGTAT